jgi:hypothetical protein
MELAVYGVGEADDVSGDRRRARSKTLFGSMDRLDVAVAIAQSPDGVVNATDLSWQLKLANNRVRAQLLTLAEVGLLQASPDRSAGKRFYIRLDSPFWDVCVAFATEWSRA